MSDKVSQVLTFDVLRARRSRRFLWHWSDDEKARLVAEAFLPGKTGTKVVRAYELDTPHLGEVGVHPVIASSARELLNKSENARSGVLSTAMFFLGLYRNPVVERVTGAGDWRIADLVRSRQPVTFYLVVMLSDINRTKPLIRLLLNQIGRRLTEELKTSGKRHRSGNDLGGHAMGGAPPLLPAFESALAFMAGYGMESFLIAQKPHQIEKAYGANNSVLDNCHVRVASPRTTKGRPEGSVTRSAPRPS